MGRIEILKYPRTVIVGKQDEERQKLTKTYGKIIYRGTLKLSDMTEHIMKHGSVYTEDVVVGVITKLKNCIQEMLADGYKVKLDGIGTLYPVLTSEGVAEAKDFNVQENITRLGVAFLADQSKKSIYKASAMRQETTLSTQLYSELTGENEVESEGGQQNGGQQTTDNGQQTGGNTGSSTGNEGDGTTPVNPDPGTGGGGGNDGGGGADPNDPENDED